MHGHAVRWGSICLTVPNRYASIGTFDFSLAESAGSRFIFAEKNDDTVGAMVVVQIEHMTSGNDIYRYRLRPGIEVAGVALKTNVFAASNALAELQSPNSESALTTRFIRAKNFRQPDQWLTVRYATYDAAGKNEFLVFYREPLDTDTLDLGTIGPSDLPGFAEAFDAVGARARSIVRFLRCT